MKSIMNFLWILLLAFIFQEVNAIEWTNLRVTWSPDRNKPPNAFQRMPQSTFEAIAHGWKALDDVDCTNAGKFNGFRFIHKSDITYSLLYSDVGYLVGSQLNIIVDELKQTPNVYEYDKIPAFLKNTILGKQVFSLTSYFIDPKVICNGDPRKFFDIASDEKFENELFFQSGRTPRKFFRVPLTRKEALKTKWSKSLCYDGMGYHSYYAIQTWGRTNCTKLYPYALLFNEEENGELIGFVFIGIGHCFSSSPRMEKVTETAIEALFGDEAPKCLLQIPTSSGMCQVHNYLVDKPWQYKCPAKPDSVSKKY